ncbi:Mobile element protein [Candidatus Enterovibrio altilux]|uniref:Mobile element protein n=1 Tax=Candidatus Enterovibrio altilux TaxID=1927128 RepID=A0A291BB75_9GAMM|nr:Mobile element protein [Candidatus Enterovibrio luxaltus]
MAMFQVKQLLGGTLSLKNHNAHISETYAMIKVLHKLTRLSISKIEVVI